MVKVLALDGGRKVELSLDSCCGVKFVIFEDSSGGDVAIDPRFVAYLSVSRRDFKYRRGRALTKIFFKNGKSLIVKGKLNEVVENLENL